MGIKLSVRNYGVFLSMFIWSFVTAAWSKPILISFDGSAVLAMWKDSLEFAKANNVRFTYFISAPYFVTKSQAQEYPYWAEKALGVPYCKIREDKDLPGIKKRVAYVRQALADGHEIASHLCGHYDGSKWTLQEWVKEMQWFRWAVDRNSAWLKDAADQTGEDFSIWDRIAGVRAPYLGVNADYYKALKLSGYKYDSSRVFCSSRKKPAPDLTYDDVNEVPIREIEVVAKNYLDWHVLPFDCNFELLKLPEDQKANVFFDSLCLDYLNSELPTQICLHFSNEDAGAYYAAMKRFVLWVKDRDPQYLVYRDY